MKVLVWIACFAAVGVIITALRMFAGLVLGGIPVFVLYVCAFFAARAICRRIDRRREEKREQMSNERG